MGKGRGTKKRAGRGSFLWCYQIFERLLQPSTLFLPFVYSLLLLYYRYTRTPHLIWYETKLEDVILKTWSKINN